MSQTENQTEIWGEEHKSAISLKVMENDMQFLHTYNTRMFIYKLIAVKGYGSHLIWSLELQNGLRGGGGGGESN
jgi:hypothetical protein